MRVEDLVRLGAKLLVRKKRRHHRRILPRRLDVAARFGVLGERDIRLGAGARRRRIKLYGTAQRGVGLVVLAEPKLQLAERKRGRREVGDAGILRHRLPVRLYGLREVLGLLLERSHEDMPCLPPFGGVALH